ncbi:glycerol-1-phosphate dehydrogenase [NAD(P)+] [Anaerobacterium chartisolvens]|uniref:Glycerol-1-phosphate dehydrogenase [NAD(P)+] n=1 Tax=Anaerobacterium chartisolvens TaxID=1297424 RepID=A0A369ATS0_9FIRM|nr:sn-glycerol-1-phosphate dehydrogenase [Anaerobacterium chartisolvens]RCX12739.1 glycerol-1-phosphate dehydrogenase [NAD(P)+] [Anaerobacterium chartisolvens]
MDNILSLPVSEMVNLSFECTCGRSHSVDIRSIIVDQDITKEAVSLALKYKTGRIFVIADNNTYSVKGRRIWEALKKEGLPVGGHIFESLHPLVPDERAVGRLVTEIGRDVSLIVAVGSGTVNDLARIISFKLGIPYLIAATAPSMDGYASTVSPLIIDGFKKTYEAVYPVSILCDLKAMRNAPWEMICAGFGDILGKYTALADWKLSKDVNNEYYCETGVSLVKNAMDKCMGNIDGIAERDESSIRYMIEALILSGIAMGLVGSSRPASGAEHHLAHYWEMNALARGEEHPLHGNSVGVGTVIVSYLYEMVKDKADFEIDSPDPEEIRGLLKRIGACDNPFELGIKKEVFTESIIHAMEIRPRYTVFHLAKRLGILEDAALRLTQKFYGAD